MANELLDEELLMQEFDFTNALPNPYYEKVTQEVTLRINKNALKYFEELAKERRMSLDRVVSIYLSECMQNQRVPHFPWEDECS